VLYALGHPLSFVVLVLSFVVVVTLHGWVASFVADRVGDRRPRMEGRLALDPRRHVDPFGAVAAALAGVGWPRAVELPVRRSRASVVAVALAGPVLDIVLGTGLLLAVVLGQGESLVALGTGPLQSGVDAGALTTLLFLSGLVALSVGLLSLVPLPPLDGGRLLFALAPRAPGWQRAEHLLVEQNAGTAVVLVLCVLPLGAAGALLPALVDVVLGPLGRLLSVG
jgi:Zn-dependent protease